jgi:hypothetical protein
MELEHSEGTGEQMKAKGSISLEMIILEPWRP